MPVDDPAIASAIRRQEERLARDPASLAWVQLADLYRKAGRGREAVTLCRDGLQRHPQYTTARLILAKALIGEGELEVALAELRALLEDSPRDVQCHRLAAEVARRLGRIDAAITHLDAIVDLDPADRESRTLRGLLRAEPGEGGESGAIGRVLRDDTFVTVAFGSLCLEQGLADEAVQVFIRLLRKNPDDRVARERLEDALRARARRRG